MDGRSLALALLTAVFWGMSSYMEKAGTDAAGPAKGPLAGLLVRNFAMGAGALVVALAAGGFAAIGASPARSIRLFAGAGLVGGVLGALLYFMALRGGTTVQAIAICSAYPAVAMLLAIVVRGEFPSWRVAVGVALVISGVVLVSEPAKAVASR